MTEADWNNCTDPQKMLSFLQQSGKASDRKLRLFVCACCRRLWPLLRDEPTRQAIDTSECFAERLTNKKTLANARRAVRASNWSQATGPGEMPWYGPGYVVWCATREDIQKAAREAAGNAAWHAIVRPKVIGGLPGWEMRDDAGGKMGLQAAAFRDEETWQAAALRDLFGPLLFCEVHVAPARRRWNEGLIAKLAQAADDHRQVPSGEVDTARLRILADALEEAGCDDTTILGHLRGEGLHWRGCWVVDAIRNKQ
jgi:hypothetical protein